MYVQTVYIPLENIDYIEEWLKYHTSIGIDHFFLYDNTGSWSEPYDRGFSIETNGKNKHGFAFDKNIKQYIVEKEKEIFKKYPVTKIKWNPVENNVIVYGQLKAAFHFAKYMKHGLCAFIDIDEFLVPSASGFKEGRMSQKRMKSRFYFESVADCHDVLKIQHKDWSPKLILDLERLDSYSGVWPETIHFYTKDFMTLPHIDTFFNHYSHSKRHHEIMLPDVVDLIKNNLGDRSFNPVIEDFESSFYCENQDHLFASILK